MKESGSTNRLTGLGILLVALGAPLFVGNSFVLSMASLAGTTAIAAISYNVLLGQTGLLSFGHALYVGLGAFAVAHLTRAAADGNWTWYSIAVAPLAGGLFSLIIAALLGLINVRRAGVVFAMITLGLAEMVHAYALMVPGFFGGDQGISFDRVTGNGFLGFSFGPQSQVYALIIAWLLAILALMWWFQASVLGELCRAVRDNDLRVEFLGFRATRIRYCAFLIAAFIAGVSGGLIAISFESVSAQVLSLNQSSAILIAAYIGGIGSIVGGLIGALVYVVFYSALSTITEAWPFYLGTVFVVVVMFAPSGLVGAVKEQQAKLALLRTTRDIVVYAGKTFGVVVLGFVYVRAVEWIYAVANGNEFHVSSSTLIGAPLTAIGAVAILAAISAIAVTVRRWTLRSVVPQE